MLEKFVYSFNNLLPGFSVKIKETKDIQLPLLTQVYFLLHNLLGYVLGASILAAIAGLVGRSKK